MYKIARHRHNPKKFCSPRKSTGQPCFKSSNLNFLTWGISKILQNIKIINLTFYSEVNTFRVVRKYFGKLSTKRKIQKTIKLYFFVHHWNPTVGEVDAALLVGFYFMLRSLKKCTSTNQQLLLCCWYSRARYHLTSDATFLHFHHTKIK